MSQSTNPVAPTIVLVHGAFADSSSWNAILPSLLDQGHPVIAAANPLRGLQYDADFVGSLMKTIDGPIVLVGTHMAVQSLPAPPRRSTMWSPSSSFLGPLPTLARAPAT